MMDVMKGISTRGGVTLGNSDQEEGTGRLSLVLMSGQGLFIRTGVLP